MTSPQKLYWSVGISTARCRRSITDGVSLEDLQHILSRSNIEIFQSKNRTRVVQDARPELNRRQVMVGLLAWGPAGKSVWHYQGGNDLDVRALHLAASKYMQDLRTVPRKTVQDMRPGRIYNAGYRRYATVARLLEDGEEWFSMEEALHDVFPRELVLEPESMSAGIVRQLSAVEEIEARVPAETWERWEREAQ